MVNKPNMFIDPILFAEHDWESSRDNNQYNGHFKNSNGRIRWNSQTTWNNRIGISPESALNTLTRDLPLCDIDILFPNAKSELSFLFFIRTRDNTLQDRRRTDLVNMRVMTGRMMVDTQQRALGRTLMRNEIEFFHAMGAQGMDIFAGMTSGAYAWARFGFLPTTECKNIFLKHALPSRYHAILPFLTKSDKTEIAAAIKLNSPTDIWAISDQRTDVQEAMANALYPSAYAPISLKLRKIFSKVSQSLSGGTDSLLLNKGHAQDMLLRKAPTTLGQYLLLGGYWSGKLDFDNPQQMNRVSNYVGGFQSINIK